MDFEQSLEDLASERAKWDALGKLPRLTWDMHARFGTTLTDVIEFAPALTEAHYAARVAMRHDEVAASTGLQTMHLVAAVGASRDDNQRAVANLGLAYKAFFFFVRSHQDALYGALLSLLDQRSGPGARMSSASRDGNPVGKVLREEQPEYLPWFERWRDLRNQVKFGVGLASLGPSSNPGVSFTHRTREGGLVIDLDPGNAVRLSHAAEALRMTKAGLSVAVGMGERNSALD